jgi:3-dehydroquinate synthase
MAEVLKHGAIRDAAYFERWGARPFSELSEGDRVALIEGSIRIKATIAAADPFERGERKLLNFGHTIGHAIEALSLTEPVPMTHGEAIAVGMVGEAHLSVSAGFLDPAELGRIEAALLRQNLPVRIPFTASIEALRAKIADDKKNVGNEVRWTLLERLGSALFDQIVPEESVVSAIAAVCQ